MVESLVESQSPYALSLEERAFSLTKGQLRQLREGGKIPGILYGGEQGSQTVSLNEKEVLKQISVPGVYSRIFDTSMGKVVLKAMQFPSISDTPLHIDLMRVTEGTRLCVLVPLTFINEEKSPGIKRGGILNIIHYKVEISVSAHNVPSVLKIDLTGMDIGRTVHGRDLKLPEGAALVKLHENDALVSVVAPSGLVEEKTEAS